MSKNFKRTILGVCIPLGLTGVAWAAIVVFQGALANFNFAGSGLTDTPFSITGVPTTSAGLDVVGEVCVDGDFSFNTESPDILGEDGVTVVGSVVGGTNPVDCQLSCYPINISTADYALWAADGTLDFTLTADADVNTFCAVNTVQGEVSVETGATGTQAIPTLSTWALLFLSSLLLLVGLRNRNTLNIR